MNPEDKICTLKVPVTVDLSPIHRVLLAALASEYKVDISTLVGDALILFYLVHSACHPNGADPLEGVVPKA